MMLAKYVRMKERSVVGLPHLFLWDNDCIHVSLLLASLFHTLCTDI
jgi:hypothetical protein